MIHIGLGQLHPLVVLVDVVALQVALDIEQGADRRHAKCRSQADNKWVGRNKKPGLPGKNRFAAPIAMEKTSSSPIRIIGF